MAAHALEPDADVVPTGHAAHAFEPAAAANVPTAQSVHALEPAFAAYLPDGQKSHALDPAFAAYLPGSQSAHALEPSLAENIPAARADTPAFAYAGVVASDAADDARAMFSAFPPTSDSPPRAIHPAGALSITSAFPPFEASAARARGSRPGAVSPSPRSTSLAESIGVAAPARPSTSGADVARNARVAPRPRVARTRATRARPRVGAASSRARPGSIAHCHSYPNVRNRRRIYARRAPYSSALNAHQ